ncbi:MAG: aminotransferase class I/II-fold pyridoxal phosphate-dependent enzyme [Lachnospiraceae bacterium]|nr:aminotransferase class I/II-fold pyridoxal phosphate-dependent enzyme [Lachnospiraceae bacterium]
MKAYADMTKDELLAVKEDLIKSYEDVKGKGISLNMSRGKPSPEQLDIVMDMFDVFNRNTDFISESGVDTRNYGELTGIKEAKELFAELLDVEAKNVIVFGNGSLPVMYDTISRSYSFGVNGSTPWNKLDKVKFLCPVPGYDRHFAITETFGIEMINIPLYEDGPDMELIKKYVEEDEAVKGIWCVPKYSNPTGSTYSDEKVKAFAALKPKACDFRIYWDNAYAVHDLYEDDKDELLNIFDECKKHNNEDIVYEFASTSKITLAGAGIAAVIASEKNLEWYKKNMTIQTIGYDKINMLRHVRYFKNAEGVRKKMKEHARILAPKFDAVIECFDRELEGLGIGSYTRPKGGYFISFTAMKGTAKKIVEKCKEAGMITTGAGATFPYKKDPDDSNIRIAPSFPTLNEIKEAAELFSLCVKIVSIEEILKNK